MLERPLPEQWGISDPALYDTRMTVDEGWWHTFGDATLGFAHHGGSGTEHLGTHGLAPHAD